MSGIQFDTNALVALPVWIRAGHPVIAEIERGVPASVCSLVWYEFACGPVSDEHVELARAVIGGNIAAVTEAHARLGAELFNATGRIRRLRTDALIVACAIASGDRFLTLNRADFSAFEGLGLQLV